MQVLLLVAFNGWKRVLEELACVEDVDIGEVERELQQIRGNAKAKVVRKKRTRHRKTVRELVEDAAPGDEARSLVERLAFAYEGKSFLPDLWRVKQFLESHGVVASRIRSRTDALPKVVHVLSGLPCRELEQLAARSQSGNDLSILANQILGPATQQPAKTHRQQPAAKHYKDADDSHTATTQHISDAPLAGNVGHQET